MDGVVKRVLIDDTRPVNLTIPVSGMEDADSIPEKAVTVRFVCRGRANFKVGSSKDLLEGREILERTSLRLGFLPHTSDRSQEIWGSHNGGGETC